MSLILLAPECTACIGSWQDSWLSSQPELPREVILHFRFPTRVVAASDLRKHAGQEPLQDNVLLVWQGGLGVLLPSCCGLVHPCSVNLRNILM